MTPSLHASRLHGRILPWLLGLLLLLNLGAVSWLGWQWYDHYRHRFLDRADQAQISGDRETAIRALSDEVEHYPGNAAAAARLQQLQQEYRQRFLKQAADSLRTGDKGGAIAAYQQQIRSYPEDYGTRMKLARLYVEVGSNQEAESVYRGIMDSLDPDKALYHAASRNLFRLIVAWSNRLKREADMRFDQGDYAGAMDGYDKVINLRARNPALHAASADRRLALGAYNNVIAKRAFTLWRQGTIARPQSELTSDYDKQVFDSGGRVPPQVYIQRETMLSNLFWDYADALYQQENWNKAADMYRRAGNMRRAINAGKPDPDTPSLLQNYALSLYHGGDAAAAYKVLLRLRHDYPYHNKGQIGKLLEQVGAKVPASQRKE